MSYLAAGFQSLLILLTAGGGPVRDSIAVDDWDYAADPQQDLTVAVVDYSNGASLTVQCLAGAMTVGISGLQASPSSLTLFERERRDGRIEGIYWEASAAADVITTDSSHFARSLRAGGELIMSSNPAAAPPYRVRLALPSQSTNLDHVLSACAIPLTSPLDDALDVGDLLTETPRVGIPSAALRRHNPIRVVLDCLIANSRLTSCRSERQVPADARAGAATANAANGTRVRLRDAKAAEGRRVQVVVTGSRIRR